MKDENWNLINLCMSIYQYYYLLKNRRQGRPASVLPYWLRREPEWRWQIENTPSAADKKAEGAGGWLLLPDLGAQPEPAISLPCPCYKKYIKTKDCVNSINRKVVNDTITIQQQKYVVNICYFENWMQFKFFKLFLDQPLHWKRLAAQIN